MTSPSRLLMTTCICHAWENVSAEDIESATWAAFFSNALEFSKLLDTNYFTDASESDSDSDSDSDSPPPPLPNQLPVVLAGAKPPAKTLRQGGSQVPPAEHVQRFRVKIHMVTYASMASLRLPRGRGVRDQYFWPFWPCSLWGMCKLWPVSGGIAKGGGGNPPAPCVSYGVV